MHDTASQSGGFNDNGLPSPREVTTRRASRSTASNESRRRYSPIAVDTKPFVPRQTTLYAYCFIYFFVFIVNRLLNQLNFTPFTFNNVDNRPSQTVTCTTIQQCQQAMNRCCACVRCRHVCPSSRSLITAYPCHVSLAHQHIHCRKYITFRLVCFLFSNY